MSGCAGARAQVGSHPNTCLCPRQAGFSNNLASPGRAGGKEQPSSGKPSWTLGKNLLRTMQGMSLPGWVAAGWEKPDPCLSAWGVCSPLHLSILRCKHGLWSPCLWQSLMCWAGG